MLDLSLCLQPECLLICTAALVLFKTAFVLRMHKVKIKIINSAGRKLAVEKRSDLILCIEKRRCQFIGENKFLSRIAF